MVEIETARLRLRPFNADDLDDLARLFSDTEVMRHLGVEAGRTLTRAETEAVLASFIDDWRKHNFSRLAVLLKSTEQLIGLCGLKLLEGAPELIYVLGKEYWGQGFAFEAASASLRFGFEALKLERIVAVTRHENAASQRVLEKLGFRYERDAQFYGVISRYYVITRTEFRPTQPFYKFKQD